MFEDKYKEEMSTVHASEQLLAQTLKRMQQEQQDLTGVSQAPETSNQNPPSNSSNSGNKTSNNKALKRGRILRFGLPAAACLVLVLFGATLIPQLMNSSAQSNGLTYEFYPVEGGASLAGGLQLGTQGEQGAAAFRDLRYSECSEDLLPLGMLEGAPSTLHGIPVYWGFDEEQGMYFAAYQTDALEPSWALLQTNALSEADFVAAVESFLNKLNEN